VVDTGPGPLGVHLRSDGVQVAVLAGCADRVELCLVDEVDGRRCERRVPLAGRRHGVWYASVPDVGLGQRYGFRVHGQWEPVRGHRHNPAKLLLDPYARAIDLPVAGRGAGRLPIVPELFGHVVDEHLLGDPTVPDDRDSLQHAPLGVVTAPPDQRPRPAAPRVPWADTVVYELHVKGFTQRLAGVPPELRGTYAGLAHPAAVDHLRALGVTTVELLPVHAIGDEVPLARRGAVNYWGYSTLSFFAPHPGYAAADDPVAVVAEFTAMVDALHAAGIEVVLDVVYNHTSEGGADGPTVSWRGLDQSGYYRLDGAGSYVDYTGCGNSLDFRQVGAVQQVLDSLRYWVGEIGVDGFRFDLATTLARGRDGYDPDHALLTAMRTDPALADVKLIAEPWDVGQHGWRTGQFPPPFAEWNDHFRDGARDFWLTGTARVRRGEPGGGVRDLATRLAGSADTFAWGRGPLASVNFLTAHDGFTLADTTAYDHKHNQANGEDNRDGSDNNRSYNHGVEGPADDPAVAADRRRSIRNLLGTLLMATGVPMLVAGDEFGRSQGGNNNAYCRDDETTWLDWDLAPWQHDLADTVRHLLRLRREHPALRQPHFFAGRPVHPDGTKDLAWFGADGTELDHDRWHDPSQRVLQMYLRAVHPEPGSAPLAPVHHVDGSLLLVVQGAGHPVDVRLPGRPWAHRYHLMWDSAVEAPPASTDEASIGESAGAVVTVEPTSVRLYRVPQGPVRT
jgi:isoamylase